MVLILFHFLNQIMVHDFSIFEFIHLVPIQQLFELELAEPDIHSFVIILFEKTGEIFLRLLYELGLSVYHLIDRMSNTIHILLKLLYCLQLFIVSVHLHITTWIVLNTFIIFTIDLFI